MEAINVQGKPVKLAPGGQIYFQVLEVRGSPSFLILQSPLTSYFL